VSSGVKRGQTRCGSAILGKVGRPPSCLAIASPTGIVPSRAEVSSRGEKAAGSMKVLDIAHRTSSQQAVRYVSSRQARVRKSPRCFGRLPSDPALSRPVATGRGPILGSARYAQPLMRSAILVHSEQRHPHCYSAALHSLLRICVESRPGSRASIQDAPQEGFAPTPEGGRTGVGSTPSAECQTRKPATRPRDFRFTPTN
jgi:hypothetical protein